MIEHDALARLGIEDPKGYIKRRFKDSSVGGELMMLGSCCVGQSVITEIEGAVEEASSSRTWVDILVGVVLVIDEADTNLLFHLLLLLLFLLHPASPSFSLLAPRCQPSAAKGLCE